MRLDRLGDLVPNGEHGIERGHRILEDHGDLAATNLAQLILVHIEDVVALEDDLAADDFPWRVFDQPHDGE